MGTAAPQIPIEPKGTVNIAPWAHGVSGYRPPLRTGIDLPLDANEGPAPPPGLWEAVERATREHGSEILRRYPDARELESTLARRLGIDPARVLVTAGGDDALDRACRLTLFPGRDLVLPVPTFEMFHRYAAQAGATVAEVAWPSGAFPIESVLRAITPRTGAIAVVSPNNPTGAVATPADLRQVARSAAEVGALVIADLAYAEFADQDLTDTAIEFQNVIAVRTLSKAWGLAGLRVGYALGDETLISLLRAAGGPYAVSGPSIAIALAALAVGQQPMLAAVNRIRQERIALAAALRTLGIDALDSQANFVLARSPNAPAIRDRLLTQGISVRGYPSNPALQDCLRITCPADPESVARLLGAIRSAVNAEEPRP
jgi:histidinol-phosphate aminotransferase